MAPKSTILIRPTVRLAAVLTAAAATVSALAVAPASAAPPGPTAQSPAAPTSTPRTTVTLPTGERVTLLSTGTESGLAVRAADGSRRVPRIVDRVGGHTYVIPAADVAAFGAGTLDLSLFDVTRLAALSGDHIPVRFAAASTAKLPGLTRTDRTSGYLTAASAARFGAAVRRAAAGHRASPVTRLSLAGVGTDHVRPAYVQKTLTLNAIEPAGVTPLGVLAIVVNTDDWKRYSQIVGLTNDTQRISVPVGHYTVLGQVVLPPPPHSRDVIFRTVAVQDITVTRNGQSVAFDSRKATVPATPIVQTPRPTKLADLTVTYGVLDRHGAEGMITSIGFATPDDVLSAPTKPARHGSIRLQIDQLLSSPHPKAQPYVYSLSFLRRTIPRHLTAPRLTPSDYATVRDRFYTSGTASGGAEGHYPAYPWIYTGLNRERYNPLFGDATEYERAMPGRATEYFYGSPGVQWYGIADVNSPHGLEMFTDQYARFHAGRTYRADWFRGALAPGVLERASRERFSCQVCRTPGHLSVSIQRLLGATPGHVGLPMRGPDDRPWDQHLVVFRDGKLIGQSYNGGPVAASTPATRAAYRIVATTRRRVDGFDSSTPTTTAWRVHSSARSGAPLPDEWTCASPGTGPCTILPLLRARLVLPTSLTGTVPAGTTSARLAVGHIQGASRSRITHVRVATSVDGKTFTRARVVRVDRGTFRVRLVAPRAQIGKPVAVRVRAADAVGNTIMQTVYGAYVVARS